MKKILLSLACATMMSSCMAQSQVTLKMKDATSDKVVVKLIDQNIKRIEKVDTLVAKDNSVTYSLETDKARLVVMSRENGGQRPANTEVFIVPGEQGTITVDGNGGTWSGTAFYSELAKLDSQTDPVAGEMNKLYDEFTMKASAGENQDSLKAALSPRIEALQQQYKDIILNYVKANPNSNVSASLLTSVDFPEEVLNLLSADVRSGAFSLVVDAVTKSVEKDKARKAAAEKLAPGSLAPDFTLKDINGNDLSLSSLRGKYVIIDFWGSWCIWCIRGMPKMKEYYAKYAGKLEILGVDCNDTEKKWKDAVAQHELPWKHVYNTADSGVLENYAIEGFPTKAVIDPEGKIAKIIVGEDPAFYDYLDSLFK